jgi:hypothetical protein
MIEFLYTDETKIDEMLVPDLLILSDRFLLKNLKLLCEKFLSKRLRLF